MASGDESSRGRVAGSTRSVLHGGGGPREPAPAVERRRGDLHRRTLLVGSHLAEISQSKEFHANLLPLLEVLGGNRENVASCLLALLWMLVARGEGAEDDQ
ncbi:hypothetical protein PVAP13_2KG221558 [Panicum virgatum]|uniref:Uncharacterized protein n=1 Tax=Panicum virgatum TaxID=38727 RepID=A0A8T0W335_PANVG|nr:hypothetical protein PVAP13_2KG221558 [Panicum virgatum]